MTDVDSEFIQCGHPRTGSTVVWNFLDELLSGEASGDAAPVDKWKHPGAVKKSHCVGQLKNFLDAEKRAVITIRHPLSCVKSQIRTQLQEGAVTDEVFLEHKSLIKEACQYYASFHQKLANILSQEKREDYLIISYQDIKLQDELLNRLSHFVRQQIQDYAACINRVTKGKGPVQATFSGGYDPKTLIHGQHISEQNYSPQLDKYITSLRVYKKMLTGYDDLFIISEQMKESFRRR